MYCDRVIKKGNTVIKLAKLAPAPSATKIAGKAQQINVDEDANNEKKFEALSSMAIKFLVSASPTYSAHWKEFFSQSHHS